MKNPACHITGQPEIVLAAIEEFIRRSFRGTVRFEPGEGDGVIVATLEEDIT